MNVDARPVEQSDPELERLVAYLDGELDPEGARDVESRLARDAEYRRRLQQLQQSWDLLDQLPKAQVDPSFTQTTIALVAVRATDDVDQQQSARQRRRRYGAAVGGLAAALAFGAAYLGTSWFGDRENRRLLRDLPVIQRLDEYRYVENIQFLRMLDREGMFAEDEVGDEM
jgi:anti-sigma factor RsiW